MSKLCPQCGAPIDESASKCEYCGATIEVSAPVAAPAPQVVERVVVKEVEVPVEVAPDPTLSWPYKNKIVAGILAILLGGIGVHKFYLGQAGKGILYLIFCWTYIPAIISFIEGLIILCSSDENFMYKYQVRC